MKAIKILVFVAANSISFDFDTEAGLLKIQNKKFELKKDTVISSHGDDVTVTNVEANDFYLCSNKETPKTIAFSAQIILDGNPIDVEVNKIYNLDSAHSNIVYVKHRKIGNREFLFSKLGPPSCQYYVIWKKGNKIFNQIDMFPAFIEHDIYSDENILKSKLKDAR